MLPDLYQGVADGFNLHFFVKRLPVPLDEEGKGFGAGVGVIQVHVPHELAGQLDIGNPASVFDDGSGPAHPIHFQKGSHVAGNVFDGVVTKSAGGADLGPVFNGELGGGTGVEGRASLTGAELETLLGFKVTVENLEISLVAGVSLLGDLSEDEPEPGVAE